MGIIKGYKAVREQLHPGLRNALDKLDEADKVYIDGIDFEKLKPLFSGGYLLGVEYAYRSPEAQNREWMKGRDAEGNVIDAGKVTTNRKGGESYHQWGLAIDLIFIKPRYRTAIFDGESRSFYDRDTYLRTGIPQFLEKMGLKWGGWWTSPFDPVHYEFQAEEPSHLMTWATPGTPWWDLSPSPAKKGISLKFLFILAAAFVAWKIFKGGRNAR